MEFHRSLQFVWLVTLFTASTASLGQRQADPLAPLVRCVQKGRFITLETARLPTTASSRSVATLSGNRSVTTSDGYRMILATSQGKPFVNLKIELSDLSSAVADRDAVEAQMQAFASRRSPEQKDLQRTEMGGVEVLALHQTTLDRPGPLSLYSMFVRTQSIIATLYVLNQAAEGRAFSSYSEYETLRDEAASLVGACLMRDGA